MKYVFVQLDPFRKKAHKLGFTLEDFREIENLISQEGRIAPILVGTHGLRKIRFSSELSSGGKSGGVRICYVILDQIAYVYLVTLFAKNEMDNLSKEHRNQIARLIDQLKAVHRGSIGQ
jgi:hypothetical protein